jgi:NifU-like protein
MRTSLTPRDVFLHPRNVGDAAEPNFTGRAASFDCGAVLRISIHVDDSQRIVDARFKAAGCSTLIAAASLLTERVKRMTTGDAAVVCEVADLLAEPAGRSECATLAFEALIGAIQQYSDSVREGWEGDEALICTCFGVSERRIETEIVTKRLTTIAEVTRACNAGAGCRSCYPLIEDILGAVKGER